MEKLAAYVVREGALSADDAVGWIVRLCATLEPIHARGSAHGRISAKAIHIHRAECVSAAYLLDSADLQDEPSHFSVERTFGAEPSPSDDCWAIGITLYAMLTGDLPYPGANADEVRKRLLGPLPSPLAVYDVGDDHIQMVLDRVLAREQAKRVSDVGQIRTLLVQDRTRLRILPALYYGRPEDIIHDEDSGGEVVTTSVYNVSGAGGIAEAVREAQRRLQGATLATAQSVPRTPQRTVRPPKVPPSVPAPHSTPAPHSAPAPPSAPAPRSVPPPPRGMALQRIAIPPPPEPPLPFPPKQDQPIIEHESVDVIIDTGQAMDMLDGPPARAADPGPPDRVVAAIVPTFAGPTPPRAPAWPPPPPAPPSRPPAPPPRPPAPPPRPAPVTQPGESKPRESELGTEDPGSSSQAHIASIDPLERRHGAIAYFFGALCILAGAAIAYTLLRKDPSARAASSAQSATASITPGMSGTAPIAPPGALPRDLISCVVPLFPADTFSGRVPDLDFVCAVEDPLEGTRQLRSQVVLAGGGARGVTAGMRELNTMGWYGLATFAVARGRCCNKPPPLKTPTTLSSCKLDKRLGDLAATANAADDKAATAALGEVTEAFNCLARGGSAAFFGQVGMPQGGELTVFMQTFERARDLAKKK